jgi:hypothetical protein
MKFLPCLHGILLIQAFATQSMAELGGAGRMGIGLVVRLHARQVSLSAASKATWFMRRPVC